MQTFLSGVPWLSAGPWLSLLSVVTALALEALGDVLRDGWTPASNTLLSRWSSVALISLAAVHTSGPGLALETRALLTLGTRVAGPARGAISTSQSWEALVAFQTGEARGSWRTLLTQRTWRAQRTIASWLSSQSRRARVTPELVSGDHRVPTGRPLRPWNSRHAVQSRFSRQSWRSGQSVGSSFTNRTPFSRRSTQSNLPWSPVSSAVTFLSTLSGRAVLASPTDVALRARRTWNAGLSRPAIRTLLSRDTRRTR